MSGVAATFLAMGEAEVYMRSGVRTMEEILKSQTELPVSEIWNQEGSYLAKR